MSYTAAYLAQYGPVLAEPTPKFYDTSTGFASRGEMEVYYALIELIGKENFRYQVMYGDLPFTPQDDNRSADFVIDAVKLILQPISAFTHPDPLADAELNFWFGILGYRVETLWDYELVPPTGNAYRRLLQIDSLRFFGQRRTKDRLTQRYRLHRHPKKFVRFGRLEG